MEKPNFDEFERTKREEFYKKRVLDPVWQDLRKREEIHGHKAPANHEALLSFEKEWKKQADNFAKQERYNAENDFKIKEWEEQKRRESEEAIKAWVRAKEEEARLKREAEAEQARLNKVAAEEAERLNKKAYEDAERLRANPPWGKQPHDFEYIWQKDREKKKADKRPKEPQQTTSGKKSRAEGSHRSAGDNTGQMSEEEFRKLREDFQDNNPTPDKNRTFSNENNDLKAISLMFAGWAIATALAYFFSPPEAKYLTLTPTAGAIALGLLKIIDFNPLVIGGLIGAGLLVTLGSLVTPVNNHDAIPIPISRSIDNPSSRITMTPSASDTDYSPSDEEEFDFATETPEPTTFAPPVPTMDLNQCRTVHFNSFDIQTPRQIVSDENGIPIEDLGLSNVQASPGNDIRYYNNIPEFGTVQVCVE